MGMITPTKLSLAETAAISEYSASGKLNSACMDVVAAYSEMTTHDRTLMFGEEGNLQAVARMNDDITTIRHHMTVFNQRMWLNRNGILPNQLIWMFSLDDDRIPSSCIYEGAGLHVEMKPSHLICPDKVALLATHSEGTNISKLHLEASLSAEFLDEKQRHKGIGQMRLINLLGNAETISSIIFRIALPKNGMSWISDQPRSVINLADYVF